MMINWYKLINIPAPWSIKKIIVTSNDGEFMGKSSPHGLSSAMDGSYFWGSSRGFVGFRDPQIPWKSQKSRGFSGILGGSKCGTLNYTYNMTLWIDLIYIYIYNIKGSNPRLYRLSHVSVPLDMCLIMVHAMNKHSFCHAIRPSRLESCKDALILCEFALMCDGWILMLVC